jgi:hypothetical protein
VPDQLADFHSTFGGERALTHTYYHFYAIEGLVAGLGYLIFAADARSGLYFGISNNMLEFKDPVVVVVAGQHRDDVNAWVTYSASLDDCLAEFASRNLCESMGYPLFVPDVTGRVSGEIAAFSSITLTKTGDARKPPQVFYAPGTVILLDPAERAAMIGLDSLPRALEFQAKHDWGFAEKYVAK